VAKANKTFKREVFSLLVPLLEVLIIGIKFKKKIGRTPTSTVQEIAPKVAGGRSTFLAKSLMVSMAEALALE